MNYAKFAMFVGLLLFGSSSSADSALEERLQRSIGKVLPDMEITEINPGPLPGIYEVMIGPTVLYMSEDGRYVMKGDILDLGSMENLTQARRAKARVAAFEEIGVENMIEFAPRSRKVEHTLYVYTDIDCGYCRKMHREIESLNKAGVAVRYLAYPRTGLEGESYAKAVSVWCAKDRRQAMTASKAGKKLESKSCENPVASHYRLGESMGIRGTPSVYLEDGESLGGYIPAQELVRLLNGREG